MPIPEALRDDLQVNLPSWPGSRPLRPGDPRQLGRWRVLAHLGSGGMGTTYVVWSSDGTLAAAKVLHDQEPDDSEFRARFVREVQVLRDLDPALGAPQVLDADLSVAAPYAIIEYIPGATLAERVSGSGVLPVTEALDLAVALAGTLVGVHDAGIVHRDVKPANVILARERPRLIDFGVAHVQEATSLTRVGSLVGTIGWLAPEQVTGDTVGPAADVYGWAATVAYAAGGRPPFGNGRIERSIYASLHEAPDLSAVPSELRPVLEAALRREPLERPTMREVLDWVRALRSAAPAPAPRHAAPEHHTDDVVNGHVLTPAHGWVPLQGPSAEPVPTRAPFSPWAVASLIVGLVCGFLGVGAALAVVFGHVALATIPRNGQRGHGIAVAGLTIGYAWIGLLILLFLFA